MPWRGDEGDGVVAPGLAQARLEQVGADGLEVGLDEVHELGAGRAISSRAVEGMNNKLKVTCSRT